MKVLLHGDAHFFCRQAFGQSSPDLSTTDKSQGKKQMQTRRMLFFSKDKQAD